MYSEPTISPNFVVRQKRKLIRHPLVIGGVVGLMLLGIGGILALLDSSMPNEDAPIESTSQIQFESRIVFEPTAVPQPTAQPDLIVNTSNFTASEPELNDDHTAPAQSVALQPRCRITTTGDTNVNIRSGPDLTFSLISSLSNRDTVNAIARSDNLWFEILNTDGTIGWVGGSVVDESGNCDDLPMIATPACSIENTTGNRVNIRDRASTESNVIRTLAVDDLLMADGRTDDGWYRILIPGELGWIYKDVVALGDGCSQVKVISASEPDPQPAMQETPLAVKEDDCVVESFTGNSVDLRKGPGMEFDVVAKMSKSMVASRLSTNGWYEVEGFGWAFAGDLVYGGLCSLLPTVQPDEVQGAIALMSNG